MTQLSPHFTLKELTITSTGLDNTPSASVITNLTLLATTLEAIRKLLDKPIQVTSAYRSTRVNNAVKGAGNSAHLHGLAADIKVVGMTPLEVCTAIKNSGISVDQCILEFDNWTHIGIRDNLKMNRNQYLTIRTGTGYLNGIVPKGR